MGAEDFLCRENGQTVKRRLEINWYGGQVDYSMTGCNKLGFLSQNIFFSDNISFLMLNKDYRDYFT